MRAPAGLLVVLLCSGCLGDTAPGQEPEEPAGPAVAADLVLTSVAQVTGLQAREPALEEAPDGTLYVAGYQYGRLHRVGPTWALEPDLRTPPPLWRSTDGGASWSLVDVGTPVDGAIGNSDVDLAMAPDGTLYMAVMSFGYVGHSIAVGASTDGAGSWSWTLLSAQPGADRPWVEVAPDGRVHVVWNDGALVHHASSTDRGATWTEGPIVHRRGGTGMLAVAPDGTLAVRIIPGSGSGYTKWSGEDGVAVSTDRGATWTFRPLPGTRVYGQFIVGDTGDGTPRWADPLAFDAAGTLYAAWTEGGRLLLARSGDLGVAWDVVELVGAAEGTAFYPHLRAAPEPGTLALTWFARSADLTAHVGLVTDADGGAPSVRATSFLPPTGGDTGGEYFPAILLRDGALGIAVPIQGDDPGFAYLRAH